MQMFRKLYDTDQENFNGVVAIHLSKSVAQPCVALAHILSVSSSFSQPSPCDLWFLLFNVSYKNII